MSTVNIRCTTEQYYCNNSSCNYTEFEIKYDDNRRNK